MMATAGSLELGHQLESGVRVVQVVVAQLLALKLGRGRDAGPGIGAADIEGSRLMGIFAVAERLARLPATVTRAGKVSSFWPANHWLMAAS